MTEEELERNEDKRFVDSISVAGIVIGMFAAAVGNEVVDSNPISEQSKQIFWSCFGGASIGYLKSMAYGRISKDLKFGLTMGAIASLTGKLVYDCYSFISNNPEYVERIRNLFNS